MNLLCILLLQFIFWVDVKAQHPSDNRDGIASNDSVSNFQPSLAVVIGMLAVMFSLTFILLLYAKFCHRASSVHTMRNHQIHDGLPRSSLVSSGVDKTVVESLPFFRFSSLRGSKQGLECSVCLAKFEDVEILRLLPKCKHAFHIDCIDQWLEKHSTCPLCRRKVSADDLSLVAYSTSLRFLRDQPEDSSPPNVELYVEREESGRHGHGCSSRFSINSFRKSDKEEELPIPESVEQPLHRFNHKIVVSDVVFKNRWSNVSSSDLMFLDSEITLNDHVSAGLDSQCAQVQGIHEQEMMMMKIKQEMERKRACERKLAEMKRINPVTFPTTVPGSESKAINPNEKRSMSEIIVHPRFSTTTNQVKNEDIVNVEEDRMRSLWLPIARKTVQWFANRERRPPLSHGFNTSQQN